MVARSRGINNIMSAAAITAAFVLLIGTQSAAAETFVSPLGGVSLLDYHVEVNAAHACAAPDGQGPTMSFTKGSVSVYPSLLKKIEKVMGPGILNTAALEKVRQVQTKRFLESSERHVDSEKDAETHEFKHWLKKNDMV